MGVFEAIVLGIVQGLTEFLPVSSSGHLVLFQNIFGITGDNLFFDTMLHVGTLVAVVVVFWRDIVAILRHPIQKITLMLIIATVPAVIAALLFGDFFEGAFSGQYLALGFVLTGALLTAAEVFSGWYQKKRARAEVGTRDAVIMGCMQAVAILPGISRSGSTLAGGLFSGVDRNTLAKFSFLMSIPVILGSVVFQGKDVLEAGLDSVPWGATIVGMLFAGISGYLAVRFMLNIIRKHRLYGFAIYVLALGALVLLDQTVFNVIFVNPFL